MMVSQMTASEGGAPAVLWEEGYVAVIQTKSCFVFQLKREVKSRKCQRWRSVTWSALGKGDQPASRSNLIWAYSSFFGE